jgi:hypothetical protein
MLTYNTQVKSVLINSPDNTKGVKKALCYRSTLETFRGVFIFVKLAHQTTNQNEHPVLNAVWFLLGDSPTSEF